MVKVEDMKFSLIYADDFDKTKKFYEKYFGFKQTMDMPDTFIEIIKELIHQ